MFGTSIKNPSRYFRHIGSQTQKSFCKRWESLQVVLEAFHLMNVRMGVKANERIHTINYRRISEGAMHKVMARLRKSLEGSDERFYFSAERSQRRYVCGALFNEGDLCGKRLWHLLLQLVPVVLTEKRINEKLK